MRKTRGPKNPVEIVFDLVSAGDRNIVSLLRAFTPEQRAELANSPELSGLIELARSQQRNDILLCAWLESFREGARVCDECGSPITGRADRRFCSARCRQRAHRRRTNTTPPRRGWSAPAA